MGVNLSSGLKNSLIAIAMGASLATSLLAQSREPSTDTTAFDQPLTINLKDFAAEGQAQLNAVFGDLKPGRIVFDDGFASNGPGLIFDLARLYYIAEISSPGPIQPSAFQFVTYYLSPQGYSSIGFTGYTADDDQIAFHNFGGAIVFKDSLTREDVAAKLEAYEAKYPSLSFTSYNLLKMITAEVIDRNNPTAQNAIDQAALLAEIKADRDVASWEDESEFFPISYGFAKPIDLGTGEDKVLDVNPLRSISLGRGIPITLPSWPAPFGEGRIPNPEIQGHPTLDPIELGSRK
ncbi:MAG: hypothetical protein EOP07_03995 [Proteobacteria bacterium]|nr:MAG: hypothetical protein EOP07_03995 [Pseudomonadota bacterium]